MGSTYLPITFLHSDFSTCTLSASALSPLDIIQWVGSDPNLRLGVWSDLTYKYTYYSVFETYLIARAKSSEPRFAFLDIFRRSIEGKALITPVDNRMTLVSGRMSTLNPNAPLFIPAAVRQVEDFSPEWWDLVTTSTWFHDYWISQQQGEDGFFGTTTTDDFDISDIADLLPNSIDADEDTLTMEAQYEQFLLLAEMERRNTSAPPPSKQSPTNGLQLEAEMRGLTLSKSMKEWGPKSPVEIARYWEKPAKSVSPKSRGTQRIQQPR